MHLKYAKLRKVRSPVRAHWPDAGFDLFTPDTLMTNPDTGPQSLIRLKPQESVLLASGLIFEVPPGHAMVLFNKSGVASKLNLIVGACVVDAGYQGEVHLHLINAGNEDQFIKPGMKVCQALILPIITPMLLQGEVDELYQGLDHITSRGSGGFGSTGL